MNIQNLTLKNYYGFTLKATYQGEKEPKCFDDNRSRSHTHHVITVKNNETGKKLHFDFWNSIMSPQITDTEELKWAFECFLRDCLVAIESYEDFISEQKDKLKGTDVLYFVLDILNQYDEDELMQDRRDMENYISDVSYDFLRLMYPYSDVEQE